MNFLAQIGASVSKDSSLLKTDGRNDKNDEIEHF